MQMKQRERWKRTCQRPGRGEINGGDSGSALLEMEREKRREMMYGGSTESWTEDPQRANRNKGGKYLVKEDVY